MSGLLRFKTTVNPQDIKPEILLAIVMVHGIYSSYNYDCIITSLNDSSHGEFSKHFDGEGVDFRTKHIVNSSDKKAIVKEVILNLTFNGYDVVFEDEGLLNEHLHVEWDPKEKSIKV